ncbi:MAG: DEAD/DEAH box helicase family protein [Pseudomonadota bacterium]
MINLRDYQHKAVELLYRYFQTNTGNPVLEAPTGAGKSVIQAEFLRKAVRDYPQTRAICLTHVRELIEQNCLALHRQAPGLDIGVHSASIGSRDIYNQVIFAGIQSAARKVNQLGYFDLILIDEAHLVPQKNNGQYREFIARAKLFNPNVKVIGFTATPYRLGGGLLVEGDDRIFTDLIASETAQMSIRDLLNAGHLSPLTTAPVATRLEVDGTKVRGGDYVLSELGKAVTAGDKTEKACEEIIHFGADRQGWLVFATTVAHGERITDELLAHGVNARMITGNTPREERDYAVSQYKARTLRALVNVNVLTTGFDAPHTDLLAFLRPTKSPGLYIQSCGRGMRVSPGKENCLVLDFAGNIQEHGPVDNVRPPKRRGKRTQPAPMRECDDCGTLMHPSVRLCPGCGKEFAAEIKVDGEASSLAILSSEAGPEVIEPTRYRVSIHSKEGKPDSLKVEWYAGLRRIVTEWVCLFHTGMAREKAAIWWGQHMGGDLPQSIEEAVRRTESELAKPLELHVSRITEYPRIVNRVFPREASAA